MQSKRSGSFLNIDERGKITGYCFINSAITFGFTCVEKAERLKWASYIMQPIFHTGVVSSFFSWINSSGAKYLKQSSVIYWGLSAVLSNIWGDNKKNTSCVYVFTRICRGSMLKIVGNRTLISSNPFNIDVKVCFILYILLSFRYEAKVFRPSGQSSLAIGFKIAIFLATWLSELSSSKTATMWQACVDLLKLSIYFNVNSISTTWTNCSPS